MKNTILMMCVVAALAIFTSPVDAENARGVDTQLNNVQLQVPGCNVNDYVYLNGSMILDAEFNIASNRFYVTAHMRPIAGAYAPNRNESYPLHGTTNEQRIVPYNNPLPPVTIPGSFKAERGTVRFEIQYTAHLTFTIDNRNQVSLAGVNYDNFRVVCL
jgi:hypothetical protein